MFKVKTINIVNLRVRIRVINICPCCDKRLLEVIVKNIGENLATKVKLICTFSPVPIKIKCRKDIIKISKSNEKLIIDIGNLLPNEKYKIKLKVTPKCECTHLMALATSTEPQSDVENNVTMIRI